MSHPILDLLPKPMGAAIEVRLYAEDPCCEFQPSPGVLTEVSFLKMARVDGWVATGTDVSPVHESNVGEVVAHAAGRGWKRSPACAMRWQTRGWVASPPISIICVNIADRQAFAAGVCSIRALVRFHYGRRRSRSFSRVTSPRSRIIRAGSAIGLFGVPPSGPMDDYAFRLPSSAWGNGVTTPDSHAPRVGPTLKVRSRHRRRAHRRTGRSEA